MFLVYYLCRVIMLYDTIVRCTYFTRFTVCIYSLLMEDLFEFLDVRFRFLVRYLSGVSDELSQFFENHMSGFISATIDVATQFETIRCISFMTALSCTCLIAMFLMFGIISVMIGIAGFLFIEGFLLIFGGVCVAVCIVTTMMIMSVLALAFGAFYLVAVKLKYVINGFKPGLNTLLAVEAASD